MNKCSLSQQNDLIDEAELYFLDNTKTDLKDLESQLASVLGINEFNINDYLYIEGLKDLLIQHSMIEGVVNTPSFKSNVVNNVSSFEINDLFHGIPVAKNFFKSYVNNLIINKYLIGDKNLGHYVSSDEELTKGLQDLKNEVFKELQQFLIDQGLLVTTKEPKDLFDKNYYLNSYEHYKYIMELASNYFFSGNNFELIKSYSNKIIPNINLDIINHKDVYEAYSNLILLSNFDSIVSRDFGQLLSVNINEFNNLDTQLDFGKYKRKVDPKSTLYWSNETHSEESVENTNVKLVSMIINSIPAYNKKNELSPYYMEMKDFYLLSAKIAKFELLFGNKLKNQKNNSFEYISNKPSRQFKWYLREIKKSINKDFNYIPELISRDYGTDFSEISNIIYSIDNYLNSPDLNIAEKEKNSNISLLDILSQTLTNSFGAIYHSYDKEKGLTVQEVYSVDFNSTGLQNTLYSKMKGMAFNSNFYNLNDSKEESDFENLFKNLDPDAEIKTLLSSNSILTRNIRNYIKNKTGINIDNDTVLETINSLEKQEKNNKLKVSSFKTHLNTLILALNSDSKSADFKKSLSQEYTSNFDSTIGKLIPNSIKTRFFRALSEAYLINFPMKSVMNIKTLSGESIPAFKIANLTYKDIDLFDQQREFQKSGLFKSLLIKDHPAILGTSTKLEITNKKTNKAAAKMTPIESLISDIRYDFLDNILDNKRFNIIIGNYSDKSTILTKLIDANFTENNNKDDVPFVKQDIKSLLGKVKSQGFNYYYDVINTVFNAYNELFKTLGININADINNFEESVSKINQVLAENNIYQLINKAQRNDIQLTEELHYSIYEGKPVLNQLLVDNYRIFKSDNLFNQFVKHQESNFIQKYSLNSKESKTYDLLGRNPKRYLKALGLSESDYDNKSLENVSMSNGELNPILKKWLWINTLFRNEYLFISTKGEYMHPHKNGSVIRTGNFNDDYWAKYLKDSAGRLVSMSKRNVANTSTYEIPIRNSKKGLTPKLNIAAIQDHSSGPYSINGNKKYKVTEKGIKYGQDSHDGSSLLDYTYAKMLDESYPGKGYSGTRKQFGTIITKNGVTIKKDAEFVITNQKILESSNSEIPLLNIKKQMLSIPINDVYLDFNKDYFDYFYKLGNKVIQISNVYLSNVNGQNQLTLLLKEKTGESSYKFLRAETIPVNNLFDVWSNLGGAYSSDSNGILNEGSNDLLYDIMIESNEGILKNKLIHILSNKSALKAGATNVNPSENWSNGQPLTYATFESRFMGPQLDASHETDTSEIKEITQIISALAQNGFTSDLAREAYEDIASIIKQAAKPYIKNLLGNNNNLYNYLAEKFIQSVANSEEDSIAKSLVSNLKQDGIKIPFSNQNFFNSFVKDVITRMNSDFISRYYPGIGAILSPSQGMIQMYDIPIIDETGQIIGWNVVNQKELITNALDSGIEGLTNEEIIQNYLNNVLAPIEVNSFEIGDTIEMGFYDQEGNFNNIQTFNINTPETYYSTHQAINDYAKVNPSFLLRRVLNKPRDLKPTLHTFNIPSEVGNIKQNIFDIQSVKFRYYVDNYLTLKDSSFIPENDLNILNNLSNFLYTKYINSQYDQNIYSTVDLTYAIKNPEFGTLLKKYLNSWTQRNLQLMEYNLLTPVVDQFTNFFQYFEQDNIMEDTIEDVLEYYNLSGLSISDINFRPAELVLGDMYQSTFDRDNNDSIHKIKSLGPTYFYDKMISQYSEDNTNADIKIVTSKNDTPIYIRFVNKNVLTNNTLNIKGNSDNFDENLDKKLSRFNDQGEAVYDIINNNVRVIKEGDKEIITIKYGSEWDGAYHLNKSLGETLSKTISSFGNSIVSIIPLMRDDSKIKIYTYDNKQIFGTEEYDLNNLTFKQFKKFTGFGNDIPLTKGSIFANKDFVVNQLAIKKYASWEKSHDVVAARIPAQSMQSFMPMRVTAYNKDSKNDAFVSISQLWMQGSDLDIDKAYILGYSFKNNGNYDLATNLSTYSTKEQIDALDLLPLPTRNYLFSGDPSNNTDVDVTNEYNYILRSFNGNINLEELPANSIKAVNDFIRYINNNNIKNVYISAENPMFTLDNLIYLVNKHNLYKGHISANGALKNRVVSKIQRIISSPSNQIAANSPIDIDDWHEAIKKVKNKKAYSNQIDYLVNKVPEILEIGTKEQYLDYLKTIFPKTQIKKILFHGTGRKFEGDVFKRDSDNDLSGHYFADDINTARSYIDDVDTIKTLIKANFDEASLLERLREEGWLVSGKTLSNPITDQTFAYNNFDNLVELVSTNKEFTDVLLNMSELDSQVLPAIVDSKNPIYIDTNESKYYEIDFRGKVSTNLDLVEELAKEKYDGVIFQNVYDMGKATPGESMVNNLGLTRTSNVHYIYDSKQAHILGNTSDLNKFKEFVKTNKNKAESLPSPYDVVSYYNMQYNATVGKEDVGIAANGVKAFFGLTDYYNNFFKNLDPNIELEQLQRSNELFNKSFTFYNSLGEPLNFNISTISDTQIGRIQRELLNSIIEGYNPQYSNAALILSGLLSAATDNAKELLMAKVNATTDLASMHIYLAILGLSIDQIVEIMTSDVVEDVIDARKNNTFENEFGKSMENVFIDLKKAYKGDTTKLHNLNIFIDLYNGSKELTALSGLFGVNQKRKANTFEIYKFLSRFDKIFDKTNTEVLGGDQKNIPSIDSKEDIISKVIDKIAERNKLLSNDRNYIREVLFRAMEIPVKYQDYDGTTKEKNVNLLKEGLDFRLYISDENYKSRVIEYYNLIKNTFNVFDIIEKVPHFREMINSLILSHNILLKSSKKYNFVFNTTKDVMNIGNKLIRSFNKDFIDKAVIDKASLFFDTLVIEKWLKNLGTELSFNVKDLMRLAGTDSFVIFDSDRSKDFVEVNTKVELSDNTNPIIYLDSSYNIANFKKIMEELILPILQKYDLSDFSNHLRIETALNNFGNKGTSIVSTFPLKDMTNFVNITQFQKLINSFNLLDTNVKTKGLIKNSIGKELNFRDLFYIYNLIQNNERFGNKRLTPIFQDYIKEKDSLGYNFVSFYSQVDSDRINLIDNIDSEEDKEAFENNLLFYLANNEGSLNFQRGTNNINLRVKNPYFVMMSDIALSESKKNLNNNVYNILRLIQQGGFVIDFKC